MNKLGISIGVSTVESIPAYAAAGFEVMEISFSPGTLDEQRAFGERALELGREHGIELWSIHLPFARGLDISEIDEDKRAAAVKALSDVVEMTRPWGPQVYVVHGSLEPYPDFERPARILSCAKSLAELQAFCGDVRLALENLPRTCIARDASETLPLSKYCSGVCFDVNHLLRESHEDFMKYIAPHVITTHLSDYDGLDEKHWMPGAGVVPWKQVYDMLTDAGYEGPWLFELGRNPDGSIFDPVAVISSWAAASGLEEA